MTSNNSNVLSYNSQGQKSKLGTCVGLLPGVLGRESISFPFPASRSSSSFLAYEPASLIFASVVNIFLTHSDFSSPLSLRQGLNTWLCCSQSNVGFFIFLLRPEVMGICHHAFFDSPLTIHSSIVITLASLSISKITLFSSTWVWGAGFMVKVRVAKCED